MSETYKGGLRLLLRRREGSEVRSPGQGTTTAAWSRACRADRYAGAALPLSQTNRLMLWARLARPNFTRALAMPMVRTTSAIGPFCRAKTCSTVERTADLRALARPPQSPTADPSADPAPSKTFSRAPPPRVSGSSRDDCVNGLLR